MSYVSKAQCEQQRKVELYSCIRSVLCNNENKLVAIYDIMTVVNRCLGSHAVSTDDVLTLIGSMSDVHRETVTGFYYCNTETACNRFRSRLQGNIQSCSREKIKRIIHTAPRLITEASQSGRLELELEELTEAEYESAVIAAAVHSVLHHLYRVNVFMKKVVCEGKHEITSYAPFYASERRSCERYWLCVHLGHFDQLTKPKKTVRFADAVPTTQQEDEVEEEDTSEPPQ